MVIITVKIAVILALKSLTMNIKISNSAKLPSKFGNFTLTAFKEGEKEHLAIYKEPLITSINQNENVIEETVLIRIHSECLTGDALGSLKCDCGEQLEYALKAIDKEGGMVIYLRQEGRSIGLLNKINAYALQDGGLNTIEANHQLGFSADERSYEIVSTILGHFGIKKIKLMTNNPKKLESLPDVEIVQRVPIIMDSNQYNSDYLGVKKEKMGHLL